MSCDNPLTPQAAASRSPISHVAQTVSFRPLAASDLAILHEWLHRPHVSEWWGDAGTAAAVEQDYLPLTQGESPTQGYIALIDNEPIGFIQSYGVMGSGDAGGSRKPIQEREALINFYPTQSNSVKVWAVLWSMLSSISSSKSQK